MGRRWQAVWAMAKILLSNVHRHMMNKCWKFQENPLILVWFIAERLKIYCNNRPPLGKHQQQLPRGGLLLQQIFSHSAITQTRIKVFSWNFQHLFIMCLCKFDNKILAIAQTACQPRPISAEILDVSSDCICWDILKRKNLVSYMSYLMEGIFNICSSCVCANLTKNIWP